MKAAINPEAWGFSTHGKSKSARRSKDFAIYRKATSDDMEVKFLLFQGKRKMNFRWHVPRGTSITRTRAARNALKELVGMGGVTGEDRWSNFCQELSRWVRRLNAEDGNRHGLCRR